MAEQTERALRYIPSVTKALEVILWLADRQSGIDVYHLVKSTFYGDKYHVARFGRPIIGDVYRAAWFGPLPQVVYGLLRNEPMEILALGNSGPLPFRLDDAFRVYGERGPNLERLSASDVEALEHGLSEVAGKSFQELLDQTHRDPAYQKAANGFIDYRHLIPEDDPQRREKIEYLEEVAPIAVL
jgi:antitoxin SocA-like protein